MAKPLIAIVGRPNVGKSTLFNKLVGARISIVQDTPGVTRDRIYYECEWRSKKVMLVDTGMDDETRRLAEDVCSRLGQGLYTYEEFEKVLASGLQ